MKKAVFVILLALLLPLGFQAFYDETPAPAEMLRLDQDGNIYFVTYGQKWLEIKKMSPDGELSGSWRTKRYYGYEYLLLGDLTFDSESGAYCVLYRVDSTDYTMSVQEWLRIDFSTGADTLIYKQIFERQPEPASVRLLCAEDELRSLTAYPDRLVTDIFTIGDETSVSSYETAVNFTGGVNDAYPRPDGTILLSSIYGELYRMSPDGSSKELYNENTGSFSAFQTDADGYIWLYLHEQGVWVKSSGNTYNKLVFEIAGIPPLKDVWTGYILDENRYVTPGGDGMSANLFLFGNTVNTSLQGATKPLWPAVLIAMLFLGMCSLCIKLIKKHNIAISLLVKQAIIILAVMAARGVILSRYISAMLEKQHEDTIIFAVRKTAHKFANLLDTAALSAMDLDAAFESDYFSIIKAEFDYRNDETKLRILLQDDKYKNIYLYENHYVCILLLSDGGLRTGVCGDYYANIPLKHMIGEKRAAEYESLLHDASYDGLVIGFDDDKSDWIAIVTPVFNKAGEPVALIEAGISKRQFIFETEQSVQTIIIYVSALMSAALVLVLFGLSVSLRSLKKLRRAVEAVGKGEYNVSVRIRGRDEVAGISAAFNDMASQIDSHTKSLAELNESYFRFLPAEVIKTLGKESVIAVRQGDFTRVDTHLLHIAVYNFAKITEAMSVDEVFAFYNNICGEVMEAVISCGGLVESYSQSELICLFEDAAPCYDTAMSVIAWLRRLNKTLPHKLEMAFVIMSGSALLGVAGHEKRLGTLMLSSSVNLSRRLAKLGELYGCRLVCPESITLPGPPLRRYIGRLEFERETICLYDYYSGDEDDIFLSKKRLTPLFESGVLLFEQQKWEESKQTFIQYLRESAPDPAVKQYIFLCEHNTGNPLSRKHFGDAI